MNGEQPRRPKTYNRVDVLNTQLYLDGAGYYLHPTKGYKRSRFYKKGVPETRPSIQMMWNTFLRTLGF